MSPKPPAVTPEPAPAQASNGTPEGTLVSLAQAVEEARTRYAEAQAALDAAIDALRAAVEEVAA